MKDKLIFLNDDLNDLQLDIDDTAYGIEELKGELQVQEGVLLDLLSQKIELKKEIRILERNIREQQQ